MTGEGARHRRRAGAGLLATVTALATVLILTPGSAQAATALSLGAAGGYAVLAGTTVSNTGPTVLNGDVGVSPGTTITGFPPGVVSGVIHAGDLAASQAQADLASAYNVAVSETVDTDLTGQDLGGLTLTPGVYHYSASAQLTGTLTLDAQGDPNAVFLVQEGSTLTTSTNSSVDLINGAVARNVFWQAGSSATIGPGTDFAGTILAFTSVTADTNAHLSGRALAINGAVTLDTVTITAAPGVPTALSAVPLDSAASLTFTPPANDGGSAITSYEASTDNGVNWATLTTTPGTGAAAGTETGTISGLTSGTAYAIMVRANNSVGPSLASDPVTVTPYTTPDAPTGLTATAGNASVVLTFTPPAQDGGSTITGYEVSTDTGHTWINLTVAVTGNQRTGTVAGLINDAPYSLKVRAVNAGGFGAESSSVSATPSQPAVPAAPTGLTGTPGDTIAQLVFSPPTDTGGNAITGYEVTTDGGATWQNLVVATVADTRTGTVSGLTDGVPYQISVRARTSVGPGAAAITVAVTPRTTPGAPTGLVLVPGIGRVLLTFIPPANDGGSDITRYEVSTSGGAAWSVLTTVAGTGGTRTGTVTGLDPGAVSSFWVRAVNAAGAGGVIGPVTVTVGALPIPAAVTAVAGTSSIVVSWDPPAGEATVDNYTAIAEPGPSTCATTGLTCVLGGVAGTNYTVTVIATTDRADSAPSAPSDSVVPTAPIVTEAPPETPLLLTTDHGDIRTAKPGQEIVIIGTGFAANSTVAISLYSGPIVLDNVVTDATGSFSAPVTIPADLAGGDHAVVAFGVDPDGTGRTMKLELNVQADAVVAPAPSSGGGGTLPTTGLPLADIMLLGLGTLLTGAVLYFVGRPSRRRAGLARAGGVIASAGP